MYPIRYTICAPDWVHNFNNCKIFINVNCMHMTGKELMTHYLPNKYNNASIRDSASHNIVNWIIEYFLFWLLVSWDDGCREELNTSVSWRQQHQLQTSWKLRQNINIDHNYISLVSSQLPTYDLWIQSWLTIMGLNNNLRTRKIQFLFKCLMSPACQNIDKHFMSVLVLFMFHG